MQESVRKLTLCIAGRQRIDARLPPWIRLAVAAFVLVASPPTSNPAAAQAWQDNDDIRAAAESYLRDRVGKGAGRTTVEASALDPRHRLPKCEQPLRTFMRRGVEIGPRTIVGVSCDGTKSWTLYVPVNLFVTADVLVAARSLPRGHLLTAGDLSRDERDVSRMHSGYLTEARELVGQRLKHQVIAGRPLTLAMIEANRIVSRGQTVTLVAAVPGINVTMTGKALMDGALNQRIRVENLNSGRIIEGIVRSREQVEILLPGPRGFSNATPKVSPSSADTQASNNDR